MKKITHIACFFLLLQLTAGAQVNWKNVSTRGMGYVDGLFIHPVTNIKYVRTDVGGIFRFDNAAQKWTNLLDALVNMNQSGIKNAEAFAFDKNTSGSAQVIYALCGGGDKSYLLKSVNDGESWSINQGWDGTIIASGNAQWRCSGEKLAVDPKNSNVVYCGTRKSGLYKTTDAALNWNKVNSFTATGGTGGFGGGDEGGISFVVFDSTSTTVADGQTVSKNIYAGVIDGGIYRSNDGGLTWVLLTGGFDANTLNPVRAVFNNNRLIVALLKDAEFVNGGFNEQGDGGLWQFTPDAAAVTGTWTNKTPWQQNPSACPFYSTYKLNAVAVKPGSPNTVYVASRGLTPRKIFYTNNFDAPLPTWKILTTDDDGGYQGACLRLYQPATFTTPATWVNTTGYDWVGDIAFDNADDNKLWLTTGNGVINIENVNASPAIISGVNDMNGLEILCVNAMASPPAPNTVPLVTAAMDVFGIRYTNLDNGGAVKLDNNFGLEASSSLSYSFNNPNTLVAIGQDYSDPGDIKRVIRSTDGGINWQSIYTPAPDCTNAPWGGNIAISATNTNNIIWVPNYNTAKGGCGTQISVNNPKYTTDGGVTWKNCSDINFSDGSFPMSLNNYYYIGKSLESDKVNGNKFYYFAMPGTSFATQLWRTTNGGANWVKMSEGALPITGGGQLKANPFAEDDIWFCPFNEYIRDNEPGASSRSLSHSTDGGATWTTLTTMDEVYAYGFGMKAASSNNPILIVYGKKNGVQSVYISDNLGGTFSDVGTQNIPEGIISNIEGDMKVNGRIYASTFCRGVWYGDVNIVLPINLSAFTGSKISHNQNAISWQYNCTSPATKFEVQRGETTSNFNTIYSVNTNLADCLMPFTYNDNDGIKNKNYYRLKITDNNGGVTLSNSILIINNKTGFDAQLLPNVVKGVAQLKISSAKATKTTVTIYDEAGKAITTNIYAVTAGSNVFTVNFSGFSTGNYFINITAQNEEKKVIRFMKQ